MDSHRRTAIALSFLAATAAVLLAAPAGGSAATEPGASAGGASAGATVAAPVADAARRRIPRRAGATRRRGVRGIAGIRVRPEAPTFADVRRRLGKPRSVRGRRTESCRVRWRGGLRMTFTTFGIPGPCARRPLQAATLTKRRWRVRVGRRVYRIGMHRRRLPRNAEHIDDWGGGGFVLADMPFAGDRTPTVLAHVTGKRIDRFYLWVGGGGD